MSCFLFDTCFLIDLQREMSSEPGRAHDFLRKEPSACPCLSWTVVGEFVEGFGDINQPACAAMLEKFEILPMDEGTAHQYAVTSSALRKKKQLIGVNEHWIAAAALAHSMPLVTRNSSHFANIPGLKVIAY